MVVSESFNDYYFINNERLSDNLQKISEKFNNTETTHFDPPGVTNSNNERISPIFKNLNVTSPENENFKFLLSNEIENENPCLSDAFLIQKQMERALQLDKLNDYIGNEAIRKELNTVFGHEMSQTDSLAIEGKNSKSKKLNAKKKKKFTKLKTKQVASFYLGKPCETDIDKKVIKSKKTSGKKDKKSLEDLRASEEQEKGINQQRQSIHAINYILSEADQYKTNQPLNIQHFILNNTLNFNTNNYLNNFNISFQPTDTSDSTNRHILGHLPSNSIDQKFTTNENYTKKEERNYEQNFHPNTLISKSLSKTDSLILNKTNDEKNVNYESNPQNELNNIMPHPQPSLPSIPYLNSSASLAKSKFTNIFHGMPEISGVSPQINFQTGAFNKVNPTTKSSLSVNQLSSNMTNVINQNLTNKETNTVNHNHSKSD